MRECKSGALNIPHSAHCTYCYAAEMEAENATLKAQRDEWRETAYNTGKERDAAKAQLAEAQQEAERWKLARQESEQTIERIVALIPRDPLKEDIFAAIERVLREPAEAVAFWCFADPPAAIREVEERLAQREALVTTLEEFEKRMLDCEHQSANSSCILCDARAVLARVRSEEPR